MGTAQDTIDQLSSLATKYLDDPIPSVRVAAALALGSILGFALEKPYNSRKSGTGSTPSKSKFGSMAKRVIDQA